MQSGEMCGVQTQVIASISPDNKERSFGVKLNAIIQGNLRLQKH